MKRTETQTLNVNLISIFEDSNSGSDNSDVNFKWIDCFVTKQKFTLRDFGCSSVAAFLCRGLFEIFYYFTHNSYKISTEKSMHWNTFEMKSDFVLSLCKNFIYFDFRKRATICKNCVTKFWGNPE